MIKLSQAARGITLLLTDEQFRAARDQIAARLKHRASVAKEGTIQAVKSAIDNPQNELPISAISSNIEQANGWLRAAGLVELMERDGFDWDES